MQRNFSYLTILDYSAWIEKQIGNSGTHDLLSETLANRSTMRHNI